ncbi:AmmeMemoRadiSam system radical SAM enzyme [Bacteroidota bacterium]
MVHAQYYEVEEEGKVKCHLCPHHCMIKNKKSGICNVRMNKDGKLYSRVYGKISAMNFDPIEKKPLYHFFPGSNILSVGSIGCNLSCNFCQNHEISQGCSSDNPFLKNYHIDEIINMALSHSDNLGIAYTYNEPTVWFEYMVDIAKKAKENILKNVMVTNGFINEDPLNELLKYVDAFSVDLKSWSDKFYKKYTSSALEPVKRTIQKIYDSGRFLEITNLVIPGLNDNETEFEEMVQWISGELDASIVLHISRYHPSYKMDIQPTSLSTLENLYDIAKKHLHYVYIGNMITSKGNNTYCPECRSLLIKREGYLTSITGLNTQGRCISCSFQAIPAFAI